MSKNIILTTGKGKNKRSWELTEEEFAEFALRFEENELIDVSKLKDFTLTPVENPFGIK